MIHLKYRIPHYHTLSIMEEVFYRFSHLIKEIFILLDNKSISKCRYVCKSWKTKLDDQKFLEVRKIRVIVGQFHKIGGSWDTFFDTISKHYVGISSRVFEDHHLYLTMFHFFGTINIFQIFILKIIMNFCDKRGFKWFSRENMPIFQFYKFFV